MNLAALIPLILKISIALSVFAIGLKAAFSDTLYLFRRPGKLLRAFVSMNVLMPLFALLVAFTFDLHPAVKIALVALSVSPIPPIMPNKAMRAGGHEDYTIGLLTASAVISVVAIPITMEVVERVTGIPLQMRARAVAQLMLSSVLIPLLAGMTVRRFACSRAEIVAKPIAIVSLVILIVGCLPILFTSVRSILILVGDGTLITLAAFALIGIIVGHLLGGPDPDDRPVLALATSSRHPAVALAIGHANFPNQKLAGALVLIYFLLSAMLAAPYLSWAKKSQAATTTGEKQVEA
jgi:bile acid:Na+ symporter, BASS family